VARCRNWRRLVACMPGILIEAEPFVPGGLA